MQLVKNSFESLNNFYLAAKAFLRFPTKTCWKHCIKVSKTG